MAGSVNKVILVGNLGRDPEVRTFQNGGKVCNLRIATSENWKDRNTGERRERTEWHTVAIFNEALVRLAEQYLRKGSKVYIEGKLQTRKWQNKEGQDVYTTEVVVDINGQMQMLDSRGAEGGMNQGAPQGRPQQQPQYNAPPQQGGQAGGYNNPAPQQQGGGMPEPIDDFDDDIPF